MIDERQEELASLYALDLLEGGERTRFEAAVAGDPALQTLVRELRESSATLAHTAGGAEPPRELKHRVLASIASRSARAPARAKEENVIRPAFGVWQFAPWAAAACLAVMAGLLAYRGSLARTEVVLVREQQTLARLALQSAENQLAAERIIHQRRVGDLGQQIAQLTDDMKRQGDLAHLKITTLASMLDNSPEAIAVAVWDPAKQNGVLQTKNLPALAADQDYQLWAFDGANPKVPVSAGTIAIDRATGEARVTFKTDQPIKALATFAISRERKGGAPQPAGPVVLLGK
ncbi:MAG TPA: anti-sigma factor [Opitutaceae bacterium]|nr:anti-sigma factor [Opitutaceae bacterium]